MEITEKIRLNRYAAKRIILAVFCASIGFCVATVMFNIYDPSQNALRALGSVCMDIICIIILIILICSFAFDNYESRLTTRMFAILLMSTIWAIFLDFLNWAFDGALEFGRLTFWFTVGSLCMGPILAGVFSLYLYSYMKETHALSDMKVGAIACAVMNVASFFITFILAITGTAFQFVDGHYEIGALYDIVTVIPILGVLYLTGYVIFNIKKVGIHDTFAAAGYIFFMVAGALIEAQYSIGTTYVAVAIADIFIFVMLQNEIIAHEKKNVQVWMRKSKTDELTGVFNRYAYEDDVNSLEEKGIPDDFVYVSVDVNSLKIVNDSYGHSAGDELIVGAARCLGECFGSYGRLYRIGGDEFIALINTDENKLIKLRNDIKELTKKWKGKYVDNLELSCGYVTRLEAKEMSIRQIAILADHRMYDEKNEYYKRTGIERRKR